jgi:hypothetical protein
VVGQEDRLEGGQLTQVVAVSAAITLFDARLHVPVAALPEQVVIGGPRQEAPKHRRSDPRDGVEVAQRRDLASAAGDDNRVPRP